MQIPMVDLGAQQAEIDADVQVGLKQLFADTAFIGGPAVAEFEAGYADLIGVRHCVGVGNGTDALELAMRAAGVGPGDEVIMPANTFIATAEAAARIGALPVPVDVDHDHLLIDPQQVAAAVTERTKAIVPVHLFGQTAFVEQLEPIARDCGAVIIEDAAQSQGARRHGRAAGSLGRIAATSFYPGKNLGAAGDAGAVLTDDDDLAAMVRLISAHGSARKYHHEVVGINSRLDSIQAVVLNAKLSRLADWNDRRRRTAARYGGLLDDLSGIRLPRGAPGNEDVWHLYVVRVPHRDQLLQTLNRAGVGAGIHYPVPIHLTPAFAHLGYGPGSFPVAEQAAREILSLPIHPHLTVDQQEFVAQVMVTAMAARTRG
ncbi:DegT/DnrJ/EryC1/StrS family aminotransferase [Microlunatus elymi]|uniref:DegT/DnrJ/EryC1/StrS family aminotransferase n=1 Tax=Microlunatus elymi TaxID=2596828 RepID=A0A516PTZ9_9ACTN|nr:DegT/DnrJ/EryC1/StrS family aminotransferase [Microlunatus elymi]QDP94600.1 DegT/DnrJ/EryC1/StrS family aminotransferase [Microlunatus elymi]